MTAMIRNLGKMSALGLFKPLSSRASLVCKRLKDEALLRKARIHPFNVLLALKTYESGRGEKGSLKWEVNQTIVQALDSAFYLSFKVSPHLPNLPIPKHLDHLYDHFHLFFFFFFFFSVCRTNWEKVLIGH